MDVHHTTDAPTAHACSGGAHPGSYWAPVAADKILALVVVAPIVVGEDPRIVQIKNDALAAKVELRPRLIAALEPIFDEAQRIERAELDKTGGEARLARGYEIEDSRLDKAVDAVLKEMAGGPFELHFRHAERCPILRSIIGTRIATIMDIERSWHADRVIEKDSKNKHALDFRRRKTHGNR
jgi:hypothetical protein